MSITVGLGLPIVGLLVLVSWALVIEPRCLRIRRHWFGLDGWFGPPLRVAVLSDMHVGGPHMDLARVASIVARVNRVRPDLVVMTGDFMVSGALAGRPVDPSDIAGRLAALRARLGAFAVLGNHDQKYGPRRVRDAFEARGLPVLDGRAVELRRDGHRMWLVGFSDFATGPRDVEQALARVDDGSPIVALTHNPALIAEIPRRVALTIAGHTHGGQVAPFVYRLLGREGVGRHVEGWYHEAGKCLFVSAGLGLSHLPFRFGVMPRVDLIELRPAVR